MSGGTRAFGEGPAMEMGDWHYVIRGHDANVDQHTTQMLAEEHEPSEREQP